MKFNKKPILFFSVALLSANIFAANAFAVNIPEVTSSNQEVVTRAEETEWVYRNYNGKIQKRLWSNTYQKWLTDWVDVK